MELRPGYKQTEVGVIPEAWEVQSLEGFADPKRPICYGIVQVGPFTRNGIPVLAIKNLNTDYFTNVHRSSFEIEKPYARSRVRPGDVLISVKGTTARVGIVPQHFDGNISRDLARLCLTDENVPEFWFQMLQSETAQRKLDVATVGTTRMELSIGILKQVRMPRAPKEEQRAIAGALGDVDALIGVLDRLIAKKRDLKQAAMQQLLTGQTRLPGFSGEWEIKQLGDVAEINMGQSPKSSNYNTKGNGLPLIQGNADIENRKTIARIFTTEIRKKCTAGDLIMSVRAPVGQISKAVFDACLGRGVCAIRYPNDYLYHYLVNQEASWAKLSKGSTFDSVNSADVKAFEIHLPADLKEQTAIAAVLSDMDDEIAALKARRDKTRALKLGMMQELLTGRIRLV